MLLSRPWYLAGLLGPWLPLMATSLALAQITPDATLGAEGSLVSPGVGVRGDVADLIEGGAVRGGNLFHSFLEFNVDAGQRVYFANPVGIESILSRITGGDPSNIFGTLGVDGAADLFLINPNGIVFGPEASLDLQGSFIATTADSIQLGSDGLFSAVDPTSDNLLTLNPSVFWFDGLQEPGKIEVSGANTAQSTLQVRSEETLSLIGGNITINNGQLIAPGGEILIVAMSGVGGVELEPDINTALTPSTLKQADLTILNNSLIRTDANNGGNILIYAEDINISNFSNISAGISFGLGSVDSRGGDIQIRATGNVTLFDISRIGSISLGVGNGGDINVSAQNISLVNGSQISTTGFGQGDVGNVILTAQDTIALSGKYDLGSIDIEASIPSGILASVGSILGFSGEGNGGDILLQAQSINLSDNALISSSNVLSPGDSGSINISTDSLLLSSGSRLVSSTAGFGNAGNVVVEALDRVVFEGVFSGIRSTVEAGATGAGGNVQIITPTFELINGAVIDSSTLGIGNAGNVLLNAYGKASFQSSVVLTASGRFATGQSGDIQITTSALQVEDGATLLASTLNDQPGGDIVLSLGSLAVLNGGQVVTSSLGDGPAGTIRVNASEGIVIAGSDPTFAARVEQIPEATLLFVPQSSLSVRASATGAAGNIIIGELGTTPRLELNDGGQITAESAAVDGGNIVITLNDLLLLRNGSLISTTAGIAQAGGSGGNITINVPFIIAIPAENSDITADAFAGTGGNVNITARGIFGIAPRSERTPLSDITASSELGFSGVVTLNTLDTSVIENSLTSLADTITDTAALTAGSCIARTDESLGSFAITGSGGLPQRPGDSGISSYPTGTVRTAAESTTALQEPDGVYQLPDGRLVLSRACE